MKVKINEGFGLENTAAWAAEMAPLSGSFNAAADKVSGNDLDKEYAHFAKVNISLNL